MVRTVKGDPYNWPYDGDLRADNTCFLVIDMQARWHWWGQSQGLAQLLPGIQGLYLLHKSSAIHSNGTTLPQTSRCPAGGLLWAGRVCRSGEVLGLAHQVRLVYQIDKTRNMRVWCPCIHKTPPLRLRCRWATTSASPGRPSSQ
jgi:hypothetical protein